MPDMCKNSLTVNGRGVSRMLDSLKSEGGQKPLSKPSSMELPSHEKYFVYAFGSLAKSFILVSARRNVGRQVVTWNLEKAVQSSLHEGVDSYLRNSALSSRISLMASWALAPVQATIKWCCPSTRGFCPFLQYG
jgi:hypothetical protein